MRSEHEVESNALPYSIGQEFSEAERTLTEKEKEKLEKDKTLVSDYKKNKLELDARKNWDLFYKRNNTNFFKDRHWTHREFPELSHENLSKSQHVLLEAGCGCGNAVFPLVEENNNLFVYACDFSQRAVDFVKNNPLYKEERFCAFQCDLTTDDVTDNVPNESVDIALMIFVLSAISPHKMSVALRNISKVLKPGGLLLFRDYGVYDHAMLRFRTGHKLEENFYVRQDGTRAYYFSLSFIASLFCACGYDIVENRYVHKRTVNKKEGIDVARIFVQSKVKKKENCD